MDLLNTDDAIEVSFAWRSQIGKAVCTFYAKIIDHTFIQEDPAYTIKLIELKHCWYSSQKSEEKSSFNRPLIAELALIPAPLADEVRTLIASHRHVLVEAIRQDFSVLYIENPVVR